MVQDANGSGLCFLQNMNAKEEILCGFIVIVFIAVILAIFACVIRKQSYKQYCLDTHDRQFNIGAIAMKLFLLSIGKVLTVLFKLLPCQSIGSVVSVHFYFGYEECYGLVWWSSLFGVVFIMLIFIMFYIILRYFMNDQDRQNESSVFYSMH